MSAGNARPVPRMFRFLSALLLGGVSVGAQAAPEREHLLWEGQGHWSAAAGLPQGAGFLLAGVAIQPPSADAEPGEAPRGDGLAAWIDLEGKPRWLRSYGGDGMDSFSAVSPAADGGACLAGASGAIDEARDAWVVRVGTRGETLWQQRIGAEGDDFATGVIALDDGGCLVALTQEVRGVPEIRLHRLAANGKDRGLIPQSATGKKAWPKGISGALHRLAPVATADGGLREGGYLLEGTQFDGKGQSRPFVLSLSPDGVPAAPRLLDRNGSATRAFPQGGMTYVSWHGYDRQDRPLIHGARLSADGESRLTLASGAVLAASLAEWGTRGVVAAVNIESEGAAPALHITPFAEQAKPLARFQGKRGFALARAERILLVAGATAPTVHGAPGRPWLALLDDETAKPAPPPVTAAETSTEAPAEAGAADKATVPGESTLRLPDGGQLFAGTRERSGSAWPQAYLRRVDADGRTLFERDLPHPQAVVTAMQTLRSASGYLIGLSVPALPGPASQRLLAVTVDGELILNTPCAEGEGRFLELSDNGKGHLSARGERTTPERSRPFSCKTRL